MQVAGNVISINLNTKIQKQGGGTYDAWEIVYRTPENEVKTLAKPIQSLKFTKGLKASLEALSPGQDFVAEMEKNARDYWEVQSVSQATAQDAPPAPVDSRPQAAPTAAASNVRPISGKVTGSNYETPEERAKKQVVIVRQSCMSNAMAVLNAQGNPANVTVENVLTTAKELEKFVFKDLAKAASKYQNIKTTTSEEEDNG